MHHRRHDVGGARGAATRDRAPARGRETLGLQDRARRDAVHGDAARPELGGQHARQRLEPRLRRGVGRPARGRAARPRVADVHDVAARPHARDGGLRAEKRRPQIDVEQRVPLGAYGAAGHERAAPSLRIPARHVIVEVMKTWLKVRLIAGFFVTVPAVATAWILWAFWSWIDQRFAPIYERMLGRPVAGLGFLTAVVLIILMGIVARNVAGRRVLAFGDRWLHRVPVFRLLYPSVKMLIDSFSPERRNSFKAVVLVQHPREGAYAFGFVTSH